MLNPKGGNFSFEYDNNITDRVISGISPTGISNKIEYDIFGNPVKTIITNSKKDKELQNKVYSNEDILLLSRVRYPNVLVAKNSLDFRTRK